MNIVIKYLSQIGIILEIFGAAYMVYESHKSRKLLSAIDSTTFGGVGEMANKTHQIISGQVKNEIIEGIYPDDDLKAVLVDGKWVFSNLSR